MKRLFKTERARLLATTIFVVFVALSLFALGTYLILGRETYYSINIQGLSRDKKTVTEAYEREALLRRNAEELYSAEKVTNEKLEIYVVVQDSIIEKKSRENELLRERNLALEMEKQRILNEKDSIVDIIKSLRRIDN